MVRCSVLLKRTWTDWNWLLVSNICKLYYHHPSTRLPPVVIVVVCGFTVFFSSNFRAISFADVDWPCYILPRATKLLNWCASLTPQWLQEFLKSYSAKSSAGIVSRYYRRGEGSKKKKLSVIMVVPCCNSSTMVTETVSFCFPYHAGSTMILYMQMIWRNNFLEIWINYWVQSNFHHYANSFANYFETDYCWRRHFREEV